MTLARLAIPLAFSVISSIAPAQAERQPETFPLQARLGNKQEALAGHYWKADGRWHLRLVLGITGAPGFADVTEAEVEKARRWQTALGEPHPVHWSFFSAAVEEKRRSGKRPAGFDDLPAVREIIAGQIAGIERMMNTPYLETKIEYFFVDDEKVKAVAHPDDIHPLLDAEVRKALYPKPFLPFNYAAIPDPVYITPGVNDPYTHPEMIAHEVIHLIGRDHFNDGFQKVDYPLDGLMNGGDEVRARRALGFDAQIHETEWNTVLINQHAHRTGKRLDKANDRRFGPTYYTESKSFMNPDKSGWREFFPEDLNLPETATEAQVREVGMREKVKLFLARDPSTRRRLPGANASSCSALF